MPWGRWWGPLWVFPLIGFPALGVWCFQWLDWNLWAFPIVGLGFPMACSPASSVHNLRRAVLCVSTLTLGWELCLPLGGSNSSVCNGLLSRLTATTTADLGAPSMGRAQQPGLMWSCFEPSHLVICLDVGTSWVQVLQTIPPRHILELAQVLQTMGHSRGPLNFAVVNFF